MFTTFMSASGPRQAQFTTRSMAQCKLLRSSCFRCFAVSNQFFSLCVILILYGFLQQTWQNYRQSSENATESSYDIEELYTLPKESIKLNTKRICYTAVICRPDTCKVQYSAQQLVSLQIHAGGEGGGGGGGGGGGYNPIHFYH